MKTYELTYIVSSGLSTEEVDNVVKEIDTFVQSQNGVIMSSEKSAAKPLSYRIAKQSSGYFVTSTLQLEETSVKPLQEKLNHEKNVLRHAVMVKKAVKASKERRTRKPMAQTEKLTAPVATKKVTEKVNPEDLDKKLDEILS